MENPHRKSTPASLRIGTSGWHYQSWWGPFFPPGVKKKDSLEFYASVFSCTELNAPFYRTPSLETVRLWARRTPDDFRFAWKASRFITHWKRLSEKCDTSLALMQTRLDELGHDVSLCISDHADAPSPFETTASWVYLRAHGPGGRYAGSYEDEALAQWSRRIAGWRRAGKSVWCFFDNDVKSAAPADAQRLAEMCRLTSASARARGRRP